MLDIKLLEQNKAEIIKGLRLRGEEDIENRIDQLVSSYNERKALQLELDSILSESNQLSEDIGRLYKEGRQLEVDPQKQKVAELKEKLKDISSKIKDLDQAIFGELSNIPNIPHISVPPGTTDDEDEIVFSCNLPPKINVSTPHWDLIKDFSLIDFDLGNKISGAGFPVYTGKGARLVRGLAHFFLDQASKEGYEEVHVPLLVNQDSAFATGQLPDKEGQMYGIGGENMFLIPTSEVPLTNIYRDVIITEDKLPIKKTCYSQCFRREAGSWGSHVRGLNRLHQFDKVEILQITYPEKSYEALEEMCSYIEGLIKMLELPYRIKKLCVGNLGFASAMTYDFEVYSMAQDKWLEVSSVSNFESFQSTRMKLRGRRSKNDKFVPHTLNGSAIAIPRILASMLENNFDGEKIILPKCLADYTKFQFIEEAKTE